MIQSDPIEELLIQKRKLIREIEEIYPIDQRWGLRGIDLAAMDSNERDIKAIDEIIKRLRRIKREAESVLNDPTTYQDKQKKTHSRFEGLKTKFVDFSQYYDLLTDRQKDCFSLRMEYEKPVAEIARRLGISRPMVDKHLQAANKVIDANNTACRKRKQVVKNRQHSDE
jgi:DNA-binding CsgD family transcriptional regulator